MKQAKWGGGGGGEEEEEVEEEDKDATTTVSDTVIDLNPALGNLLFLTVH